MQNRLPRKALCGVVALAALAACSDDLQPTAAAPPQAPATQASPTGQAHGRGPERTAEEHGRRIARQVPDFGGWFFDGNGDLNVWVKNSDLHGARARAAVAQVANEVGLIPAKPGYRIIIRPGRYGWQELSDWRDRVEAVADGIEGIRWVDLDEGINRVAVGVNSGRARAEVRKQAAEVGIPTGALSIQSVEGCPPNALDCSEYCTLDPYASGCSDPCSVSPHDPSCNPDTCSDNPGDPSCNTDPCAIDPEDPACAPPADGEWSGGGNYAPVMGAVDNESLEAPFTRLRAGIRTASNIRPSTTVCSIGAVAIHPSQGAVFLTNSHCTYDQGGVEPGTPLDFYQHYLSGPLFVGNEVVDPPYQRPEDYCSNLYYNVTKTVCRYPVRNADAALIKIENRAYDLGLIARPVQRKMEGQGAGSIVINQSRPTMRIVYDLNNARITVARGNRLDKVGASTGWTSGTVQAVCVTAYQTSPNRRRHTCQNRVNYTNAEGDSGGPVFYFANDTRSEVWLLGIHHMKDGTYSPLTQVAKDIPGLVYR
jgi:hypothetical protein